MNRLGNGGLKKWIGRYFSSSGSSRKRTVNVRKINPKVPFPEAFSISQSLYAIIKNHGPLTIPNTWNYAKEANISGLNSKTHMKIMLKWMRGRNMLKLFCNQVGPTKKFLHCTLPEQPLPDTSKLPEKPSVKRETQ